MYHVSAQGVDRAHDECTSSTLSLLLSSLYQTRNSVYMTNGTIYQVISQRKN